MDVDEGFDVSITRDGSARNEAEYSVASPHPDFHTCNSRCGGGGERMRSLPLQNLTSSFFVIKSIKAYGRSHISVPNFQLIVHFWGSKTTYLDKRRDGRVRYKRLRSPGIDSGSLCNLAGRYVVSARQAGNRFLGSLKALQLRALCRCCRPRSLTRGSKCACAPIPGTAASATSGSPPSPSSSSTTGRDSLDVMHRALDDVTVTTS
jgi:hypothetical protein